VRALAATLCLFCLVSSAPVRAQAAEEPDHEVHEALREVLQGAQAAVNAGDYDGVLPYLTEDVMATSLTQGPMTGRAGVAAYFREWFGPDGYMGSMQLAMEADALTELSPDKRWGLVRGKGAEHYEARNGDQFDFDTRWTAVMVKGDDGRWRVRAIHFGTNHLDNPVLTRVRATLVRYGVLGAIVSAIVSGSLGLGIGWFARRRRT
jgi:ketosteroid isomerase-like protein